AFARALILDPTAPLLQRSWLAAWSAADPDAPAAEARMRLVALDPIGLSPAIAGGGAEHVGDLVDLYGVRLPDEYAAYVRRGGARGARGGGGGDGSRWVPRGATGRGPGGPPPRADQMPPLVEAAAPSPARRRWLVRVHLLRGGVEEALAAADAPEPVD